ncbi:hypothetical protein [Flagellimonas meishanensis]|uniref:hypothetical protein n=1 Tax=Flagellimonas meishanensis TaxID=2873264 RepID=UPI001CA79FE8|nr:hypothetical protein [[Muricauda] meishanensis]
MKRWIGFLLHLAMIAILTSFGSYTLDKKAVRQVPDFLRADLESMSELPQNFENYFDEDGIAPPFLGRSYNGFKDALAFKESRGRYQVVNTLGYLGKYQFGLSTLNLMGVYNADRFLADAALQEAVFDTNIARNKWILRRDIKTFKGKRINGVEITESGILAAAHLAGAGNVKKYLRSYGKEDVADAYGSNISYYMRKFAGYDISAVQRKRNPKV